MAVKEVAISKRLKISQAQQMMLLAVLGAAIVLGVALSLSLRFVKQIAFNAKVLGEEGKAVEAYSNMIRNVGVCVKPKGAVYSADELKKCKPNEIELSQVPNTLRTMIMQKVAADEGLGSVLRDDKKNCIDPETQKNYTYEKMDKMYKEAEGEEALTRASNLIKSCSALRLIPNALPAFRNEEALMASLNKIFIVSKVEPESIAPNDVAMVGGDEQQKDHDRLREIRLSLSAESDGEGILRLMGNIERSIREFSIDRLTIEWGGSGGGLTMNSSVTAFYVEPSSLNEVEKVVQATEKKDEKVNTKKKKEKKK